MEVLGSLFNVALLVATLRMTAPILLVALGGSFTTKAGIFNIGLEGQMLVGAFFAVLGSIWSGSALVGVACGVAAALVFALAFAVLVVSFRANEVVVGLALNILAGGMTISLMKAIFGTRGSIVGQGIVGLPKVQIPGARDLFGSWAPLINGFTPMVYLAFIAVPLLVLFYKRTRLGLYIRVVGEKPEAAEALGISITRVRYTASLLCGLLAGLAGAHLSLGYITMFTENMSSGRGFMAVAILIFSAGDPLKVLAGCLLFGFADAFSLRLQTFGFPSYLILAVPYLVALVALFALSYRSRPKIIRETLESMKKLLSVENKPAGTGTN
ncbi:ABC transporter permease [Aminobacter sp. MET-1]|uniref:ABC transporter permease n=1 Tax=Aminobacter sp. MET-1 TaxID=2951085 RepID=UPI00226AD284|nr:ABC transporter permease [Aminobacter sp. MET-1]MCX8572766.1 ABC transporter permease [Aminobacter sp. MET-1]